jgi:hypothetical protein
VFYDGLRLDRRDFCACGQIGGASVAGTIRKSRRRLNALKLEALRMRIKAGVDTLERGDFMEIDEVDLGDYLERLTVQAPQVE